MISNRLFNPRERFGSKDTEPAADAAFVNSPNLLGYNARRFHQAAFRRVDFDPMVISEMAAGYRHHENCLSQFIHVVVRDNNRRPELANLMADSRVELDPIDRAALGKRWTMAHQFALACWASNSSNLAETSSSSGSHSLQICRDRSAAWA